MEVNATQRLIESLIGHSSLLLRPLYGDGADINPDSPQEMPLLLDMQSLGYVIVGMNIDPSDYDEPGVDEIVKRVNDQLFTMVDGYRIRNHVILLHDGGGNRDQTVKALPRIIDSLRQKGFRFVTVTDLLPPGSRVKLFPVVPHRQGAIVGFDRIIFESDYLSGRLLAILFLFSITLGVLRVFVTAPLAILQSRRARRSVYAPYSPPVTVVIAAYNEEAVICRTIDSVLANDYPDLDVIVVDDGSTDNTAAIVGERFKDERRVHLFSKKNGGKSTALNFGISKSDTDFIVSLDADTIFASDTIRLLMRHFVDPSVGAVAGNVKVGNRNNPLTIWQSVEYITSQNFDRRAYALMNSVSVVPGAVGVWRKSAIIDCGGYNTDTLAEDTDLTFKVRLKGYKIVTENEALAFTEAPDTVRALAGQRFRWAFGTLQCLWKYRYLLFRRKYGAFSMFVMPSMWLFSVLFQVFAPMVDLTVIFQLIHLAVLLHQRLAPTADIDTIISFHRHLVLVLRYYGAFFVLDLMSGLLAFGLDKENPWQLIWLFWQRFFYRQFMYYIIIKSIVMACKGGLVGWGKLQRKGTVSRKHAAP
jgi:cellulose synthase/poly-beta-1,6-N-acetylglucosamine synthase-like glycosyltransferase